MRKSPAANVGKVPTWLKVPPWRSNTPVTLMASGALMPPWALSASPAAPMALFRLMPPAVAVKLMLSLVEAKALPTVMPEAELDVRLTFCVVPVSVVML